MHLLLGVRPKAQAASAASAQESAQELGRGMRRCQSEAHCERLQAEH